MLRPVSAEFKAESVWVSSSFFHLDLEEQAVAVMVGHQREFTFNLCAKVMAPSPRETQKWDPTVETALWELNNTSSPYKPQGG